MYEFLSRFVEYSTYLHHADFVRRIHPGYFIERLCKVFSHSVNVLELNVMQFELLKSGVAYDNT
jgi:hypothetical protein